MIASFADRETEHVYAGKRSKKLPPSIHRVAMRKLYMIQAAVLISDLRVPPGNRLEKLAGDYAGYYSVRINNQWRICFHWKDGNAYDVSITDYH
jgi:proteic killer suppression protein